MIPDSLLIQVDPIRWIGGFSWNDVILAVIITFILYGIYMLGGIMQKRNIRKQQRKSLILKTPEKDDPDFLLRSSEALRNYIHILYLPAKSRAHTATEISHYVSDEGIIEALRLIEIHEYSETTIEDEKKGKILTVIQELEEKIQHL